jgi:hypothetical protein
MIRNVERQILKPNHLLIYYQYLYTDIPKITRELICKYQNHKMSVNIAVSQNLTPTNVNETTAIWRFNWNIFQIIHNVHV